MYFSRKLDIEDYPNALVSMNEVPEDIFIKGSYSSEIFCNCISIVGSRKISSYGYNVISKIVPEFVRMGLTVVSGFMYGVDIRAHEVCLDHGGRTVGVLPCGVDLIYPPDSTHLYSRVLENRGLFLSEHGGTRTPRKWTFINRNKIVAALSQVMLVVEAASRSGSLITANYALDYGKHLYVIPHNIGNPNSEGIFELIRKGASILTGAEDVVKHYSNINEGNDYLDNGLFKIDASGDPSSKILLYLREKPRNLDELLTGLDMDYKLLTQRLMSLTVQGKVTERNGKYYVG